MKGMEHYSLQTALIELSLEKKTWIILNANSSTGYVWRLTLDNSKVYRIDKNFYLPSRTGSVELQGKQYGF